MVTPEWIYNTLKDQIEKIVQEEAENAAARVRQRVREASGEMAVAVLSQYSIETGRDELIIRVRNPK